MKSRTVMLRTACAALALAAASAPTTVLATERVLYKPASSAHSTADGSLVDVQVQVSGSSAPLFFRPGQWDRHYFEAFKGRNYSLVVRNTTGRRVGVVIAVDGINVVNGEITRLANDEPMYVLDPYERAVIRGWRTSLDEVRKFVFVDEERSYAERTGQANGDLGWIRVLAFREVQPFFRAEPKVRERRDDLGSREESAAPAPSAERAPLAQKESRAGLEGEAGRQSMNDANPGTGWGDRKHDPVQRTFFQAERRATDHLVLRYEYANGLRALGIHTRRPRLWDREDGLLGFAKPPKH